MRSSWRTGVGQSDDRVGFIAQASRIARELRTGRREGVCLCVLSLSLQIVVSHIVSGGLVTSVWYRIPQYSSTQTKNVPRPHPPRRPPSPASKARGNRERDAGRDKGQRGGRGAPWLPPGANLIRRCASPPPPMCRHPPPIRNHVKSREKRPNRAGERPPAAWERAPASRRR